MIKKFTIAATAAVLASIGMPSAPAQAQQIRYIGEIFPAGYNFCRRETTPAEGQLLPISQFTALFSIFGTTFGGDGRTTFGLPDLRGRVPVHTGRGPGLTDRRLGERAGAETTTLSVSQMPSHTHTAHVNVARVNATVRNPINSTIARDVGNAYDRDNAPDSNFRMAAGTVTVDNAGGGQAVTNLQPSLVLRYCVVLNGVFPSRP